jgi:hypothetical protein
MHRSFAVRQQLSPLRSVLGALVIVALLGSIASEDF